MGFIGVVDFVRLRGPGVIMSFFSIHGRTTGPDLNAPVAFLVSAQTMCG